MSFIGFIKDTADSISSYFGSSEEYSKAAWEDGASALQHTGNACYSAATNTYEAARFAAKEALKEAPATDETKAVPSFIDNLQTIGALAIGGGFISAVAGYPLLLTAIAMNPLLVLGGVALASAAKSVVQNYPKESSEAVTKTGETLYEAGTAALLAVKSGTEAGAALVLKGVEAAAAYTEMEDLSDNNDLASLVGITDAGVLENGEASDCSHQQLLGEVEGPVEPTQ
ncbi:MAG: hypothetical protein Tsb006_2920 [Rickettsiaceae bacterium]